MKAVVFRGAGEVEVRDVPEPVLADPADAIVRVEYAGICGTDLHLIHQDGALAPGDGLGHEFVGVIVEAGAAVRGLAVGDRVTGADFTACGACWWCRGGYHWECAERTFFGSGTAFGAQIDGAQAEYVRVPFADVTLQRLPADTDPEAGLFLGDIVATGYGAVQRADFAPGSTVAVVGGGPVGQIASQAAQACSAGFVVVVEPVAERRELAQRCGALAVAPDAARAAIDELTDGRGADAVIEAAGGARGLEAALGVVRRRGTVVSVGVPSEDQWTMPLARCFADEITLSFAIGNAIRDRDALTALLRAGVIDPTVIIDGRVGLADAVRGYTAMHERRSVKTIIVM
ncbi:alcohol dehydrogenase catalytic domain-containing protein [Gordonia hydrophobica]|uniref:Alcohol dehydrogenase catalytic domain-containing protein n=1 Tax=Gordonia hydrophobica TaxID=40516 RepID=A0ABZ2U705_9ACTN|nr:alcohol dehydrogenase catalytic domain-containing protein [Gordonia hydrophobica]MBM7365385.1 threonine dehydrogenase-like Zn-dependent dehydrogenase [Gordonia hydrophobica]